MESFRLGRISEEYVNFTPTENQAAEFVLVDLCTMQILEKGNFIKCLRVLEYDFFKDDNERAALNGVVIIQSKDFDRLMKRG